MPSLFSFRDFRREPESIATFIAAGDPKEAYRLALLWQVLTFALPLIIAGLWLLHS